ncbi:hypothetical protein B0H14DRAFT_2991390, partial [Mycena olivaceomarginata]
MTVNPQRPAVPTAANGAKTGTWFARVGVPPRSCSPLSSVSALLAPSKRPSFLWLWRIASWIYSGSSLLAYLPSTTNPCRSSLTSSFHPPFRITRIATRGTLPKLPAPSPSSPTLASCLPRMPRWALSRTSPTSPPLAMSSSMPLHRPRPLGPQTRLRSNTSPTSTPPHRAARQCWLVLRLRLPPRALLVPLSGPRLPPSTSTAMEGVEGS